MVDTQSVPVYSLWALWCETSLPKTLMPTVFVFYQENMLQTLTAYLQLSLVTNCFLFILKTDQMCLFAVSDSKTNPACLPNSSLSAKSANSRAAAPSAAPL